jgi:hypothetical protein
MHIEMQLMSIDAHWNALNVREVLNQSEKNKYISDFEQLFYLPVHCASTCF